MHLGDGDPCTPFSVTFRTQKLILSERPFLPHCLLPWSLPSPRFVLSLCPLYLWLSAPSPCHSEWQPFLPAFPAELTYETSPGFQEESQNLKMLLTIPTLPVPPSALCTFSAPCGNDPHEHSALRIFSSS